MSRPSSAPDWLVARPIAHRGLHDRATGRVENSIAAARAAMAQGFTIECDVQLTADDEAVVFHDFTLDRLTAESGAVRARTGAELARIPLDGVSDRIATLPEFLSIIDSRVPLVCEIKSRFDRDMRLADRVVEIASRYPGPLAIKSFDADVVAHLRDTSWAGPLGIVAEATYNDAEWSDLSPGMKQELAEFLHFGRSQPDFLSYHVGDLPHAVPYLCRTAMGLPVMAWTVRTPEQRQRAATWADQMVFESFVP